MRWFGCRVTDEDVASIDAVRTQIARRTGEKPSRSVVMRRAMREGLHVLERKEA